MIAETVVVNTSDTANGWAALAFGVFVAAMVFVWRTR